MARPFLHLMWDPAWTLQLDVDREGRGGQGRHGHSLESPASNTPHLPHGRNPLSFCRRRNLGDLRAQPARNQPQAQARQSHTVAPSRDPLTTNFGYPFRVVLVAPWPRSVSLSRRSPCILCHRAFHLPLILLPLLARWASEANFFHSFHSFPRGVLSLRPPCTVQSFLPTFP